MKGLWKLAGFPLKDGKKDALKRLEAYSDIVTLCQLADQIFISDDVQVCKTDTLIFRSKDELLNMLNDLKPQVPIKLVTKMSSWVGRPRLYSWADPGLPAP